MNRATLVAQNVGFEGDLDAMDEHVGKTFGHKYRIDKLIAKGGMGRVYKSTQFPLERPVAIKILNREFQDSDPQFVKRFFLEASTAAQLSHPHTITVFDYGESEGGDLYIAMEYLKGRPLSRIVRDDGPFSAEEAVRLSIQICRALRAAHEKGIIHRDLKPGNIFILEEATGGDAGYAKVLDFGLVKLFTPESRNMLGEGDAEELTRTGTLLGSPKYMSPEQIQGQPLDPRTDIYSFGIILYQMISGKAPFTGTTGVDVIYKHVNFPVPSIASQNATADCSPELEKVIRTCLEKRREDRFPSMDALLDRLKEQQKQISSTFNPVELRSTDISSAKEAVFREPIVEETTNAQRFRKPARSTAQLTLVIAGIGFLVALTTLIYVLRSQPQMPADAQPAPAVQEKQLPSLKRKSRPAKRKKDDVPPNYRENPY